MSESTWARPASTRGALEDIRVELARLQGTVAAYNEAGSRTDQDHETRIRKLEAWRYALPASALIAVGSIVISILSSVHH